MRRLLPYLVVCSLMVGCDGDTVDGQETEAPATGGEVTAAQRTGPDSKVDDEETLPGIGDGETGSRLSPSGGTRDAGVALPGPRVGAVMPSAPPSVSATAPRSGGAEAATSSGARSPTATPSAPTGGFAPTSDSAGTSFPSRPVVPSDPIVAPRPPIVPPTPVPQPRPGTLTAGTWDDNRNFDFFEHYRASLAQQQIPGILPFTDAEFRQANEKFGKPQGARVRLDIALVIDTTGSMGDEISYLQSELVAISRTIELAYPQSEQRWALVVYRDEGDEYATRYFDFRDSAAALREKLAAQRASGGGDFPEAPQAAFAVMNQFAWRTGSNVARLAFWVADAPHHAPQAANLAEGIRKAQTLGVHVYPVASSGIDELTELTMRSAAQLTGGRYLFLTDDSRVGNSHKEPTIPCYFVTKLDEAMFRMVSIELSGVYREPDPQQIIRIQGGPNRGVCRLTSGQDVQAF